MHHPVTIRSLFKLIQPEVTALRPPAAEALGAHLRNKNSHEASMLILGITGGADLVFENRNLFFPHWQLHDSAAALVDDGKIVAAIEEERLNRIKHTNKGPVSAIRFCLNRRGARLADLDRLVVGLDEQIVGKFARSTNVSQPNAEPLEDPRGLLHALLVRGLGEDIADEKIHFVHHHMAHALSAYALSGFDSSLVVTMDGGGDDASGMVLKAEGITLDLISKLPIWKSLGLFYLNLISFLGYELFDEYKVMGLAPYGDPSKYRHIFRNLYDLLPDGDYTFKLDLPDALAGVAAPRKRNDPLTQVHKDIAASLQESLEEIVFHMLQHYRQQTGHTRLCLAGGVAHNCTLNGKLLYSRMFEDIFIQPAAHDAGLALGAALYPFIEGELGLAFKPAKLEHVYLGTDVEDPAVIRETLGEWEEFIEFHPADNITEKTAELLASGSVIGWVQGRSEFGPRSLGNRSIIADPRPTENKDIINRMVKKREGYRPFAPSVLEEFAGEFFDLPDGKRRFPFMTFVVKVRENKQKLLGGVTHVDGTARIQTVSRGANGKYWELIDAFREMTGVPMLLNTSFNNNVEPIVESAKDAIVSFLTTELHYLVIGDYLVSKKPVPYTSYWNLLISLPAYAKLTLVKGYSSNDQMVADYRIGNTYRSDHHVRISSDVFDLLFQVTGEKTLGELLDAGAVMGEEKRRAITGEILELWSKRVITLNPR